MGVESAVPHQQPRPYPTEAGPETDVVPPAAAHSHPQPAACDGSLLHAQALSLDAETFLECASQLHFAGLRGLRADISRRLPHRALCVGPRLLLLPGNGEAGVRQVQAAVQFMEQGCTGPAGRGTPQQVPSSSHIPVSVM